MTAPTLTSAEFFAGIGGFIQGFEDAGIETKLTVEKDGHCNTILQTQFPNILKRGDIHDVKGKDIGSKVDIFSGGFPCQDTSIAAPHRLGLAGSRSGNFVEFARVLDEYLRIIDELSEQPRWVVIENPVGLLASPGRSKGVDRRGWDMAAVVRGLEDLGYGWAYRVVDGRYLGTPQSRERVIVVGHLGGDPRPAWQVLGDDGPGAEVVRPDHAGRSERGPGTGPIAEGDSLTRIWRKGARSQVALRFHDHRSCPPPGPKGKVPKHECRGSFNPAYRETWVDDGTANTLTGFDGGLSTRQTHLITQGGRLRTATLTEWERLQGFPDGWTEGIPDSARYTALGNAMHVGMARWLGRRIVAVHHALPLIDTRLIGGAA